MQRTILIVDDSKLARMVISGILARTQPGWSVVESANAREALAVLDKTPVDIVLVDFNMPDTDGLELAARIRASGTDLPLAIVSANAQDAIIARARELGATFLEKPLTDDALSSFLSGADLRLRRAGK